MRDFLVFDHHAKNNMHLLNSKCNELKFANIMDTRCRTGAPNLVSSGRPAPRAAPRRPPRRPLSPRDALQTSFRKLYSQQTHIRPITYLWYYTLWNCSHIKPPYNEIFVFSLTFLQRYEVTVIFFTVFLLSLQLLTVLILRLKRRKGLNIISETYFLYTKRRFYGSMTIIMAVRKVSFDKRVASSAGPRADSGRKQQQARN